MPATQTMGSARFPEAAVSRAMSPARVAGLLASMITSAARRQSPGRLSAAAAEAAVRTSAPQPVSSLLMASACSA